MVRGLVALLCMLLMAAPVWAAPGFDRRLGTPPARRPVAVIVLNDTPTTRDLAEKLDALLQAHAELLPISPSDAAALLDPLGDSEELPRVTEARELLARADAAVARFELRDVPATIADAQQKLLAVSPRLATPVYADAMLLLGQVYLAERQTTDATAAFALVHRLDPTRTLDPAKYVPEVIAAFEVAKLPVATRATLDVRGSGRVWLDGTEVGEAPSAFEVSAGTHVVWLGGPERAARGAAVPFIASGATLTVAVPDGEQSKRALLQRARRTLADAPDPAARAGAMKHLADLAGVHDAVLLSVVTGKLIAQTWRDRVPGFSALREIQPGERAQVIVDMIIPPPPPPPRDTKLVFVPAPEAPRWYKKRAVKWVAVGVVVGGLVGLATYVTRGISFQAADPNTIWPTTSRR
ncbi:MAG TPA: hypothetical protein VGM88_10525 [Kofleriaceae bacterium]|jgi:hypothetical protein